MAPRKVPARVLIVDDEALIRWALAESLRAGGFEALEAETVDEAYALIARGDRIDAALIDLRLPDGSGLHVLDRLRAGQPACRSFLMTAYGAPESREAAAARGAMAVVSKPFDLGDIMRLLESALQDRSS